MNTASLNNNMKLLITLTLCWALAWLPCPAAIIIRGPVLHPAQGIDKTGLLIWLDLDNSLTNQHNPGTYDATAAGTTPGYTTDPFADSDGALNLVSSGSTSWAYIAAAGAAGLDPAGNFSAVFWGKDTSATTGSKALLYRDGGAGNVSWRLTRSTSTFDRQTMTVSNDGTNTENQTNDVGDYPGDDGQWHHYAVTYNSGSSQVKFYVAGALVDTVTYATETGPVFAVGTTAALILGATSTSSAGTVTDGAMSRVSWWARELSGAEITTLYNGGADKKYAGL